jgi:hypothetical protein
MGLGGSRRYQETIGNKRLLTAEEAAAFRGVSIKWLRENLECLEWHHCNFKYGDHARAFFWDRDDFE